MTDNTNETGVQQAQGVADRGASAPQEQAGETSFMGGISDFFAGTRGFFQGTLKGGIGEMSDYGDSVIDGVETARSLAISQPLQMVENFVFGLFSWDWGKDFSFSKNYDDQVAKASGAMNDMSTGWKTVGAELNPLKLLDILGMNGQQITTPEQEAAVNGNEGAGMSSDLNSGQGR